MVIQNYSPVTTNFNWCSYYILQALYDLSYLTFQTSQSYFKISFLRNPKNVWTISFRNCLHSCIFTISWNIFQCGKLFFVCGAKYELIDKRIFSLGKRFSVFWEKIFQFFPENFSSADVIHKIIPWYFIQKLCLQNTIKRNRKLSWTKQKKILKVQTEIFLAAIIINSYIMQ